MKQHAIVILIYLLSSHVSTGQKLVIEEYPTKLSERVNTWAEELLPVLSSNGKRLYFVRSFYNENTGGHYAGQDIWFAEKDSSGRWQEAVNLRELNSELNNAIIGTNQKDDTLFLLNSYTSTAREAYGLAYTYQKKGRPTVLESSGLALKILGNRKWTIPREFPLAMQIQGDTRAYYVSPEQDVVIYSTESTDSHGKEDLQLYFKKQGTWHGPVLLDENINSKGAEISPFLTRDKKTLFFASDGRDGLGDFDIYLSERLDESSWGKWSPAINVGEPINTKGFDAYFVTRPSGDSYFVSDRYGSLDIYHAKTGTTDESREVNVRNVLDSLGLTSDRLNELIHADASCLVGLAGHAFFETPVLNLSVSHSRINTYLSAINSTDRLLTENTRRCVAGTEDSQVLAQLKEGSLSHQVTINAKMTECQALAGSLAARAKIVQLTMDVRDSLQVKEVTGLLAVNAHLKKDISGLIDKNAQIKLQLQNTHTDQSLILKLDENNLMLQGMCDIWERNLEEINRNIQGTPQKKELLARIGRALAFADSINRQIEIYLQMDVMIRESASFQGTDFPDFASSDNEVVSGPDSLNQRLAHVRGNNAELIQNLKQYFFRKVQNLDRLTLVNSQYVRAIRQGAFVGRLVSESDGRYYHQETGMALDPRQEILSLIAQNAATYLKVDMPGGAKNLKAINEIERNNLMLAKKMVEWGTKLQEFLLATKEVIHEKRTILIRPSEITDQMEVKGYTIQIVAMNEGIPPGKARLEKFSGEVIKMSRGRDGLDRYYIRQYDSKRKAMKEVRKLRTSSGFGDLFVRAIAKYNQL